MNKDIGTFSKYIRNGILEIDYDDCIKQDINLIDLKFKPPEEISKDLQRDCKMLVEALNKLSK